MFIQLFSNYLVGQSVITIEQRDTFQEEIQKTRVKLGTIAIAEGLLTEAQAEGDQPSADPAGPPLR